MADNESENIEELFYRQYNPKEEEDLHFGDDALDKSKRLDENGNPVDPNQAPGLDPNDLPENLRTQFRHADPKVHAEFSGDLIQPCQEESLVETEEYEEEQNPETQEDYTPAEETDQEAEDMEEESTSEETEESEESGSPEETEDPSDGPLLCPNCGQELFPVKAGEKTFYKHNTDQENACTTIFPNRDAVLTAIKQQEEAQEALKAAEEEERKKQEEAAKLEQEKAQEEAAASDDKGKLSPEQSAVYMEFFSKQLSNIMQALGEIKSKEAQLDKIQAELAALKTEVQTLSEEKEAAHLNEIAAGLEKHTSSMKDVQEKMEKVINHVSGLEDDIRRMKEAERDLLLVTDNAGQQFYQFMNSVESLRKTDIQLNNVFPLLDNYIKLLDSEYTAKLKTYSEKQAELGNHFKKQSEKFLQETSKRMKFEAPAASSMSMTAMIVPTIISFVLMFILKYVG